jgi:hypothetical protein
VDPTADMDVVEKGSNFILAGNRILNLVGKIRNLVYRLPNLNLGKVFKII